MSKECRTCGIEKELEAFTPKQGVCKPCRARYMKSWREKNHAKARESEIRYTRNNMDVRKRWIEENKDRVNGYVRNWRVRNKEKTRQYKREFLRRNPSKLAEYHHRRRAKERSLRATLTTHEWHWLKIQSKNRCVYCGTHEKISGKLQQEHVIPVSQDGAYTIENIRPACKYCNTKKHAKTPEQAGMTIIISIDTTQYEDT